MKADGEDTPNSQRLCSWERPDVGPPPCPARSPLCPPPGVAPCPRHRPQSPPIPQGHTDSGWEQNRTPGTFRMAAGTPQCALVTGSLARRSEALGAQAALPGMSSDPTCGQEGQGTEESPQLAPTQEGGGRQSCLMMAVPASQGPGPSTQGAVDHRAGKRGGAHSRLSPSGCGVRAKEPQAAESVTGGGRR